MMATILEVTPVNLSALAGLRHAEKRMAYALAGALTATRKAGKNLESVREVGDLLRPTLQRK